jgi:translation initiation factor 2 beta subunit (eIF-2beta)/eIF-5
MNNEFMLMVDEAYELLNKEENQTDNDLLLPKLDTEISVTKLYWKNIMEYMNLLNRNPDHFVIFIKNELCNNEINWYSDNNKKDGIIIHGKRQKNARILEVLKKYINVYVICSSCKKKYTELTKITSKKYQFKCLTCEMTKIFI